MGWENICRKAFLSRIETPVNFARDFQNFSFEKQRLFSLDGKVKSLPKWEISAPKELNPRKMKKPKNSKSEEQKVSPIEEVPVKFFNTGNLPFILATKGAGLLGKTDWSDEEDEENQTGEEATDKSTEEN